VKALTQGQLRSIERTLSGGTWTITFGAVLFSVLTVTPLVQRVTPDEWDWTAPILPLVVDAAVVIVIRLDSVVSRLGESGGRWPALLRWMTGLMTLGLNTADSALKGDRVGVAVHAVAPLLLLVTAEAALAWRRAIARAHDRIAAEQAEQEARERAEQEAREHAAREERERERAARERAEREAGERAREEREHAERIEREREDRAAAREREEREHAARLEREREERAAAERREQREHADRLRREEQEREERERRDREAREERERQEREREARQRRERQVAGRQPRPVREQPTPGTAVHGPATEPVRERPAEPAVHAERPDRMSEEDARRVVVNTSDASVRQLAETTGWSIGWISKVRREATPA
jgi:hypothetical protein